LNLSEDNRKLKCLAVTKGRSVSEISEVINRTGFTRIGENRLEEAEKLTHFPDLEKHYLGKLQSRKIAKIVKLFDVIQSVETLKQAESINKQEKNIRIYLQVNLDGDQKRSGCRPSEVTALITKIQKLPYLKLKGLMGMASQNSEKARAQFRVLKSLQAGLDECSMGMSSDYEIAIEEGSTMLRLGRCLFDKNTLSLPDGIELE
jgi:PLP dependent protein